MKKIGFDLNDTMLSCLYDNSECNTTYFWEFTSYDKGNCWTFNSVYFKNILHASQTGQYYGLKLELFTGFDGKLIF